MIEIKEYSKFDKDYLVDVPVKTNIWCRPECQRTQFEILKKARPSVLFVISDGGRNEKEQRVIEEHRRMFDEEIDWNCTIYKNYEDNNTGMYNTGMRTHKLIWNNVDRCILMEDDTLPSISFFRFCSELLERYKDDKRISCICGSNIDGVSRHVTSDYFFSRQGGIWGIALWKRTFEEFNLNYKNDSYILNTLQYAMSDNKTMKNRLIGYSKYDEYEGHIPGPEFYLSFLCYAQNQLQIIPKYNMISNVGCQVNSAHAGSIETLPRGIRRVFNMKRYEYNFPLKAPEYVVADLDYEKRRNRVLAFNHPMIRKFRRLESLFLNIKHGNLGIIKTKSINVLKKITGKYHEA